MGLKNRAISALFNWILLSAALICAAIVLPISRSPADSPTGMNFGILKDNGVLALGDAAPPLNVRGINGALQNTDEDMALTLIVDFGSIRCQDCINTTEYLEKLRERYGPHGLKIIMINVDPFVTPSMAEVFRLERNLGFEIYHDVDGVTAESYGINLIPSQFLIDREGIIRAIHVGFDEGMLPDDTINSLLNIPR